MTVKTRPKVERRQFRIPPETGSSEYRYTYDVKEWEAEWNKLTKPLEDLGFVVTGIDPGIQLSHPTNQYAGSFSIPVWAAELLLKDRK